MINAAQYVRMSTDHQPLSIETQKAAIQAYAETHNFEVVATYADEARSGIKLLGREGMQRLLKDVMETGCAFKAILVLDVSRWGRFQDVDESAYYEYHCRKNGVNVIYVAEAFSTNSTPFDAVMKQLKRTMAAEYSRELGIKSRAGQITAISLGFATGRLPSIGYRREAVSADGTTSRELGLKERKPRVTDRVRWVLGPSHETEALQWMFDQFVNKALSIRNIVSTLNANDFLSHRGERMTEEMVRNLLSCEVVTGTFSWGTRSRGASATNIARMEKPATNSTMVAPLVDRATFEQAQVRLRSVADLYNNGPDRQKMLDKLQRVLKRNPSLIRSQFASSGLAHPQNYRKYFGSVTEAFRLARRSDLPIKRPISQGIRANKRFFMRDVYQALVAEDVSVDPKPYRNRLIISGVAVRTRCAEPRNERRGLKYWLVRHLLAEPVADTPWLLVLFGDQSGLAHEYVLLCPEAHAMFNGRIELAETQEGGRYRVHSATTLISKLRAIGCQAPLVR